MQKELGRYLFPVFLEKRKSKQHSKQNPPKPSENMLGPVDFKTGNRFQTGSKLTNRDA